MTSKINQLEQQEHKDLSKVYKDRILNSKFDLGTDSRKINSGQRADYSPKQGDEKIDEVAKGNKNKIEKQNAKI